MDNLDAGDPAKIKIIIIKKMDSAPVFCIKFQRVSYDLFLSSW